MPTRPRGIAPWTDGKCNIVKEIGGKLVLIEHTKYSNGWVDRVPLGLFIGTIDTSGLSNSQIDRRIQKIKKEKPESREKRVRHSFDFDGISRSKIVFLYIPFKKKSEFERFKID